MQIGFYHESAGTRHAGGIAVYIQHMAAELSTSNDVYLYTQGGEIAELVRESDVTVVETPRFDDRLTDAIATLTPLGSQDATKVTMTGWAYRNGIVDHIEEHTDVVFTFQFMDDLLLSNLVDVPTVYGFHRVDGVGIGTRLRERFSATDLILANTADTARQVNEKFGYETDEVIYPGVDLEHFHPDAEPAFSSDVPVVLYVGRLVEQKGVYDLIEAFAGLDTEADLCIVGRGDTRGVRTACREHGILDSLVLEGEVPHVDLPGYYAAADVFCLPTRSESFGMVNVEAMACGTPVVTSDLAATREYVSNGENGLLAQVDDPIDVRDKLAMLLASPDRRASMGERARDRAREFSWGKQARRLERFCAKHVAGGETFEHEEERAVRPPAV